MRCSLLRQGWDLSLHLAPRLSPSLSHSLHTSHLSCAPYLSCFAQTPAPRLHHPTTNRECCLCTATATLQPCLCNMATSPIHGLPPELLQKVWSFLPVFDLLRCQRVCKGWNTFLPGDDQALHRAMFSPATLATSPGTSSWDVCIDFRQHHRVQLRALPRLVFSLDVTTSTLSREEPMRQTPTGE